ncbi:hypothetical protein [Paenisporosarcina quisquiliarum]|uniref:hypothetical protein n=1 Tax=Paenisporosarcina quisquiliarum TaxID=365346 RepID=UPI003736E8B2
MVTFFESLQDLTSLLLFISSIIFHRQLKLTKWKRKLSKGEMTMFVITSLAIPIYGVTYFVLLLGT